MTMHARTVRTQWMTGVLIVACVSAALFVLTAGRAVGDTPPGWEPEGGTLGSIAFYDANGHLVTGGDLGAHPSAFFAAASGAGRTGDSKAQLKAFTPQVGVAPALWSGDTLTGATTYPNVDAPPTVATMTVPVVSGTAGDLSFADYIGEFPNTLAEPGYANLYELRLYTSGPGQAQNVVYFRTDIRVTVLGDVGGAVTGLWDVVYPPVAPTGSDPGSGPATSSGGTAQSGTASMTPTPPATGSPTVTATVTGTATVTATATATVTAAPNPIVVPPPVPPPAAAPAPAQATDAAAAATTPPTGTVTISAPRSGTASPSFPDLATPTAIGGDLSLANRSTSMVAFGGLWLLLAVVGLATFVQLWRRVRRDRSWRRAQRDRSWRRAQRDDQHVNPSGGP